MANYVGSNYFDDVMGAGTSSAGTMAADRWSSGDGNDTFVYSLASMTGADRFSGGAGFDTVEFRLTTEEWANLSIKNNITRFKSAVDNRASLSAGGELAPGTGYSPISFGIGKSLTALEVENVRVYAGNTLVLGANPNTRTGEVKEAGVNGSYAAISGTPQATGSMPGLDEVGSSVESGARWSITGMPDQMFGTFSITPSGVWTYSLDNDSPATQSLQEGQTVTQVFLVAATMGTSAAFSSVIITVEGTNDKAKIQLDASGLTVSERSGPGNTMTGLEGDGVSGFLTYTNVDGAPTAALPANQPFAASITVPGTYGDLVVTRLETVGVQTTAVWGYTLRNGSPTVQALVGGAVVFDVIALPASEFDGAQETITVRVVGGDDWAEISTGIPDLAVTEAHGIRNDLASDAVAGGICTQTDVDTAGPLTFAPLTDTPLDTQGNRVDTRSSIGKFGNFSLDPRTGIWTYTLDNNRAATEALQAKGTASAIPAATETLTVANSTTPGATQTITVNIYGGDDLTQSITNVFDPVNGATVEARTGADFTAGGQLTLNDADGAHDTFTWTPASPNGGPISIVSGRGTFPDAQIYAGQYGDFTLNGTTGSWSYARNDTGLPYGDSEALKSGQAATDAMIVKSNDGGASVTISVTILGRDDPAVMTGKATGEVLEAGGPRTTSIVNTINPVPAAHGNVQSADKDAGESGWSVSAAASLDGNYGDFSFNYMTGDWSYSLRNLDGKVEALIASQQVTDLLVLTSKDGNSHTITVTITGANDQALIALNGEQDTTVKEAGGVADGMLGDPNAGGDLDVADVDGAGALTEARFRSVPMFNQGQELNDLQGSYGFFSFDANTGRWTYTLDNASAATQSLNEGQLVTDTMLVYSKDVSASQIITVTVAGSYDQVDLNNTYTADETTGGHQVRAEGSWRNASGAATPVVTDYSAAGTLFGSPTGRFQVPVAAALVGVYGSFSVDALGTWSYTLDNEDPDTLALLSTIDSDGRHVPSAQDFLSVASTTNESHPVPETYTIRIDVYGAYTLVDFLGLPADAVTPNAGTAAAQGALPAIHRNGTLTFTLRNGDIGETMKLYAGNPNQVLFPWGTVTVNDGSVTTIALPTGEEGSSSRLVNEVLYVWDGDQRSPALGALSLGVSVAQGTAAPDAISMVGDGGMAAGYAGNDHIAGTSFIDYIDGGNDDDLLEGGPGNDTILGGNGDDELLGQGNDDRLEGGSGHDTLMGGDGADVLVPGPGRDLLTGGADNDVFLFSSRPLGQYGDDDVVSDYSVVDDTLWFDQDALLSTGVSTAEMAGNDWFNTASADQIATQAYETSDRFIYDTTNGFLYFDPDGGTGLAPPALVAAFAGSPALVAAEFVFGTTPGP